MKNRRNKLILLSLVVCLIAATLFGCTEETSKVDNNIQDEGNDVEFLIVENGQVVLPLTPFNTLNPLMTNNLSYHYFSKLIFEGLFEHNEYLEPVPNLVESYKISEDGNTVSLKLREDVYWHDGEKFSSKDVLFTINALNYGKSETAYGMLLSSAVGAFYNNNTLTARIIDDYNIEIKSDVSFSNLLDVLTFPIIPEHKYSVGKGNNYSLALQLENYNPVGTGPFKFVRYDKNKNVSLEANEYYWKGKPQISFVNGKVFADEELFITAYEAGQLSLTPVFDYDWDKYAQNSRSRILEYISSNYEFLGFNFNKEIFNNENGDSLRKAIVYGINRQEIIRKIFLGHATQSDVPISPNSYLFSEESNYYGYNKELSKELLSSLGFIDTDDDGFVEDSNGNKLSLNLITNPSNEYRLRAAQLIREDLKEIGIDINLDFNYEYDTELTEDDINMEWDGLNTRLRNGDYDIVLLGWQISNIPELSFMYHSNQLNQNNFINYSNPTMDQLLEIANSSYNKEDKISAYNELQKLILEDLPYISLYYKNGALLVDSKIKGDLAPTFVDPYYGLEKCFIVNEIE